VKTPTALVGLTREGVLALGARESSLWSDAAPPPSAPLEVHVAVTSRCAAGCEGCYLDARPDGVEPPRAEIEARLDALAEAGVFTVAFGGGEPTLRDDLGALADHARARGLTPVVTTSGLGLGPRKIAALTRFAQVNVSYDGAADDYTSVRGFDGAAQAEEAISSLSRAGVLVGVNVVLTRATFPRLRDTLARARERGAREAQLLRYKPAGRAKSLHYLARRLSAEQIDAFPSALRELVNALPGLRLRIDCALVPFLSSDPSFDAAALEKWGVFGCEAGAALAAQRVDGAMLPCSFGAPEDLEPFRAYPAAPAEPCASCTLRSVCRGGCKVVSRFTTGRVGPDPECPRVRV
jgi:radical SAM protein with 4Fe4S-binding SPASM domain